MCCDPHRCQICEGREDGTKALLKPKGGTALRANRASTSNRRAEPYGQTPSDTDPFVDHAAGGPPASWSVYAHEGGAQQDDARVFQRRREEEARFADSLSSTATPDNSAVTPDSSAATPNSSAAIPYSSASTATPSQLSSSEPLISVSPDTSPVSINDDALIDLDEYPVLPSICHGQRQHAEIEQFNLLD